MTYSKKPEETLDPENWDEMKVLAHRMVDDMLDHIKNSKTSTNKFPTKEERQNLMVPLSKNGEGDEKVYESIVENALPSLVCTKTARFWGFVVGSGSPYGMLTSMLTGAFNMPSDQNISVAFDVNRQTLNWVKDLLNYPREASGIFVTGGSEANFTGLAVARTAMAEIDMKHTGMQGVPRKMTIYVSEEGHHCLERSVELLGFGGENLRLIPTDDDYRIKIDALKEAINRDRAAGYHPFCVIGNAGTVNTGAFDDFNALANLAEKEKLWLHVDGAFGAWVKISKTHKHLADGMERADSLAVDLHKWMSMPYGIGCTLTRHPLEHLKTFVYGEEAAYFKSNLDKPMDELLGTSMFMGLRLSNEFLALKPYMLLRANGSEKYGRIVQQNIDQINYLADQIRIQPDMEVCAPVASNIVCFRYSPDGLDEKRLEKLNHSILLALWDVSFPVISDTTIKGKYVLRACNVNHRSRREDFDWLITEVRRLGEKLLPEVKNSR
jgi:glutamate/tyrosine decarboxylase-like PLP-dependent enzyme